MYRRLERKRLSIHRLYRTKEIKKFAVLICYGLDIMTINNIYRFVSVKRFVKRFVSVFEKFHKIFS